MTRRKFCKSAAYFPAVALWVDPIRADGAAPGPKGTPAAYYMLRYFVRSETATQQTEELMAYCNQNHISHVILFNGNHWDLGWNLPTLEEARARVDVLRPVFQRLRQAGLRVSINMWTTLGHADIGRDERNRFSWQFMVGDDGAESRAIPCPLDPKWKNYIGELYGLLARLEPEIIYIDDDFRYHNHNPVAWGCFCPLHLEEMARRTGKTLGREDLVRRILTAEWQPTIEREQFLKLCGESLVEATRIIGQAVKKASSKTHMGLMCSDPNVHAAEGRRWLEMVEAMSVSGNRPVLRPHYASYQETNYREVPTQITPMRKLQPLLANQMRFTPELENWPFTRFSKSVALTRLQMALSFFIAPPDLTIDIHSFVETRFDYDPGHDRVLRDSFDYFCNLTEYATECRKERGLQILWDDRFPLHRKVSIGRMTALPAPRCWEGTMDLMGFGTTFYPEEVKLASRAFLEERTDEELRTLLAGKVLIDGDAASLLVERGFGPEVGLKSCQPLMGANAERLVNEKFAGKFLTRDESTFAMTKYRLEPVEPAVIVSKLIGPEETFSASGMMLFENSRGGRVGLIPFNGSRGDLNVTDFRSWKRQHVLRKMLEWIHRGPLPLFVEDAPNVFPLRRDGENVVVVGIANLTPEPMAQVTFRLAPAFSGKPAIEYLNSRAKGKLLDFQAARTEDCLRLQIPLRVEPLELVCFRITEA